VVSDVWSFRKNEMGQWGWQRESPRHEPLQQSETVFQTFEHCLADAHRFGYVGSISVSEQPPRDAGGRLRRHTRR
jgi:hypothetical protein